MLDTSGHYRLDDPIGVYINFHFFHNIYNSGKNGKLLIPLSDSKIVMAIVFAANDAFGKGLVEQIITLRRT